MSTPVTPDQVKCRLMSGAHPAVNASGNLAYTVFQQGAGLVDAHDAAYSTASGCANQGLNIPLDLAGLQHYGGRANEDSSNGNFYIMAQDRGERRQRLLGGVGNSSAGWGHSSQDAARRPGPLVGALVKTWH